MAKLDHLKILPDFIENSKKKFPSKIALYFEDEKYTYKQLSEKIDRIAGFLSKSTNAGDVIALLLPNSPEFIFAYFGILKSGCTALLLPPNISDETLKFQINKTRPKYIISSSVYIEKIKRSGVLKEMKFLDIKTVPDTAKVKSRLVKPTDTASIIFTSGTTSEPKGVKLQHKNIVQATKNIIEFVKFDNNDIDVNISALSHSFGLGHVHCIFAISGTVVLFRDSINLKKIIETIRTFKATTFGAVPAILRLIISHYQEDFKKKAKNLRFIQTNTSLLEKELIQGILTMLPKTKFHYYYGLSEASRSTFLTFNDSPDKLSSVGKASPNVKIKISDHNKTIKANGIGEICIYGKHVISEYWKNAEASKKIRNGWLHTGDVGYLDEDGFLYFVGRKDDVINVAGEKVIPEEIEEVAKKIPGVKDAAAVSMPDRLLGESVKLFIVLSSEKKDFTSRILETCRKHLENFKVPRAVEYVQQIPRTENGKLMRNKLRNIA